MFNSIPSSAFRRVSAGENQIPVWAYQAPSQFAGAKGPISVIEFDAKFDLLGAMQARIREEFVAHDPTQFRVEIKPMTIAEGVPSVFYLTPEQPRFEVPGQNLVFALVKNTPKADAVVPVLALHNRAGAVMNESPVIEAKHELGIPAYSLQILTVDSNKPLVTLG